MCCKAVTLLHPIEGYNIESLEELNQTGSISGTPGTEEDVHEVSNSNQEELTERCVLKVRLPTFLHVPALEHCHLALYSSRIFKKVNNPKGKRPTNNDFGSNLAGQKFSLHESPISQQDQHKSIHLLSASLLINMNGYQAFGGSRQLERQSLKLTERKE